MLSQVPGKTLADKLNNAWVRLQTCVNCIFDSTLDKLSKDVNPGIKQVLVLSIKIEPRHAISNNVVCATSKGSDQPAHKRSLIRAFASCLIIL